jgi:hypothetical protein
VSLKSQLGEFARGLHALKGTNHVSKEAPYGTDWLLPLFGGSTPGGSVVDPWNCGVHGDSVEACFVGVDWDVSLKSQLGEFARGLHALKGTNHVSKEAPYGIVIAYHTVVFDVKTSALPLDTENGVGLYLTNAFMNPSWGNLRAGCTLWKEPITYPKKLLTEQIGISSGSSSSKIKAVE